MRAHLGEGKDGEVAGTLQYEILKSGSSYENFMMSFSRNQYLAIKSLPNNASRAVYGAKLLAYGTLAAAVGIQVNDLLMGRDPQDMTKPLFWGKALLKSGGLGVVGDIFQAGEASWGGGFLSYVGGPIPQLGNDLWHLGPSSLISAMQGEDTGLAKKLARMGKRYMPLGQSPIMAGGAAFDRLVWDQMQLMLDPESVKSMAQTSKKRKKDYGGGEAWMPGSALPNRLPNLGTAFGG